METWIFYSLLSVLFAGTFVFCQKIAAERGYNSELTVVSVLTGQVLFSFVIWGMRGFLLVDIKEIAVLSIITGILYTIVHFSRLISLRYIDSAIYFPIYKAIGPTIVVLIGFFIFKDNLKLLDWIGITMGITVPLLLVSVHEKHRQSDLVKGGIYLLIGVLLASAVIIVTKFVADTDGDIFLYVLGQSAVGLAWIFVTKKYSRKIEGRHPIEKENPMRKVIQFGLMVGCINAISIFVLTKALETGPLSIVYTISSFYILVPIVLSILIYREHINLRKGFAIGLSLLAITFFQF